MRNAITITYAENNKGNQIQIDNYGTTTFIGFAQILFNNNLIDYATFLKSKKVVLTDEFCTKVVNEHPELFPIYF